MQQTADTLALRLPNDLGRLTPGAATDALDALLNGRSIEPASLMRLLQQGAAVLRAEPSVIDLRPAAAVTVVGDLHGCMSSLRSVLELVGEAAGGATVGARAVDGGNIPVVFNGDFVDRGKKVVG